jgi:catechol 1,2-dioxygenase
MTERTTPDDITAAVLASFGRCPDERLAAVMRSLTAHLHAFVKETGLTEQEWRAAVRVLTETGHITSGTRQEWILWSDALGVSMLVDALANRAPAEAAGGAAEAMGAATESTVQGPFYVPGAPLRSYGDRIDERPAGEPLWVHGTVRSVDGRPLAGAELDVWQNGDDELYAVQDPQAPEEHLRGRFLTGDDGGYAFLTVRPTPYPIPHDGPVGRMLSATGRHPWRPAHIHVIVRAPGHRPVTTHIFDRESKHIGSDAVFAVKPSLLRELTPHSGGDQGRPAGLAGHAGRWWSLASDFVLAPSGPAARGHPG